MSGRFYEPRSRGDYDRMPRGVLRKGCCFHYREKLRAERRTNVIQGCLIALGLSLILGVLVLNSQNPFGANRPKSVESSETALAGGVGGFLNFELKEIARSVSSLVFNSHSGNDARDFYCKQQLDGVDMFRYIRTQVLNQEHALNKFEQVLRKGGDFKAVALLGPSGVGKSLTAACLRQKFPWQENVHAYSWSTYVSEEGRKFHLVRHFIDQLSNCGQNLIIVDNLQTCDYSFVPIFNGMIKNREGDSLAAAKQSVLVVYIFNLEAEHYWEQLELLQLQLPNDTTIINFHLFGYDELADCLHHELKLEKRTMTVENIKTVLDKTNVFNSGCKSIRRAVITLGTTN